MKENTRRDEMEEEKAEKQMIDSPWHKAERGGLRGQKKNTKFEDEKREEVNERVWVERERVTG